MRDAPDGPEPTISAASGREVEAALKLSVEALTDPSLVCGIDDNRVLHANAAATRSFAFERAELTGRCLSDLVHPDDEPSLAFDAATGPRKIRFRNRSGALRSFTVTMVAFSDRVGLLIARTLETNPNATVELLQGERMAALQTLSMGVAHEINNPLTYALASVEFVARSLRAWLAAGQIEDPEGKLLQALGSATAGMQRVGAVVRDLMTFAQGNVEKKGLVDVRAVLESSIQMSLHEIEQRARLVRQMREVGPVEANETRLAQAFLNLLQNAAQAVSPGHVDENEIRVATYPGKDDTTVVEIADTGQGIEPALQPRIFEPFFSTKSAAGLGLSLSHAAVREVDGRIEVESTPGKGTRFFVRLPTVAGWSPAGSPCPVQDARKGRVLVIDDDPRIGHAIELTLQGEHEVTCVTSAQDALGMLRSAQQFDVILCDLTMPIVDGVDFYAEALRIAPDAARTILFITGGPFTARTRAFVAEFRSRCLTKPIDANELRRVVRAHGRARARTDEGASSH